MAAHHNPQNQALALYVHWPFCRSKCPYCDFNSHVRESVDQSAWAAALVAELRFYAARVGRRSLSSIFFGGGTPSLMPPATVARVIDAANAHFVFQPDIEITLEANPTSVEAAKFVGFSAAGVNRLSLGVQSLDPAALKFLGREHDVTEALQAVELAVRYFPRYSFDLIYARPNQTLNDWQAELQSALQYAGGHISLYQLTIELNTAFHHAYYQEKTFQIPDEEQAAALYRLTADILAAHGLSAYEVSNYAKSGEESRHNLAYWLSQDYLGIGPGAHGRFVPAGQMARVATQNIKSPERWLEQVCRQACGLEVEDVLTPQQCREEWVMMGLRLTQGLEKACGVEQLGMEFDDIISPRKREFYLREGLLEETPTHLRASERGMLLLNSLTAELLT